MSQSKDGIIIYEGGDGEQQIRILFLTAQIIRASHECPVLWKLTEEYLDALCLFMRITSHEELMTNKFLEGSIDLTTNHPYCIATLKPYLLIK